MSIIEEIAKMSINQYEFFVEYVFEEELDQLSEKEERKFLHNKYQIRLNKHGIKLYTLYKQNLAYEKQIRNEKQENIALKKDLESRNKKYNELVLATKKIAIAKNLAI